jgi:hypothetical protein
MTARLHLSETVIPIREKGRAVSGPASAYARIHIGFRSLTLAGIQDIDTARLDRGVSASIHGPDSPTDCISDTATIQDCYGASGQRYDAGLQFALAIFPHAVVIRYLDGGSAAVVHRSRGKRQGRIRRSHGGGAVAGDDRTYGILHGDDLCAAAAVAAVIGGRPFSGQRVIGSAAPVRTGFNENRDYVRVAIVRGRYRCGWRYGVALNGLITRNAEEGWRRGVYDLNHLHTEG